jgi:hypothetical protein
VAQWVEEALQTLARALAGDFVPPARATRIIVAGVEKPA